ncbi:MAG: 1-acyl-sn-glycerol-3-phosphate acyltransferase [Planctomycetaceae bacterium]|nr:1-acyl-sn-glycerol-3-phosphate acyltransferase [Planctomycetaceae bacterium]
MTNVVLDLPYVPVPPGRGRIWPLLLGWYAPWLLRGRFGVRRTSFHGVERLRASLRSGHGVLLAPNHCREEDPFVVGLLCRRAGTAPYTMASRHIFEGGGLVPFLLTRAGAFSVHREGIDRAAVNTAIDLLEEGRRPLVLFGEGHIARTNDRLNLLQEGVSLIARTAARRRTKAGAPGGVLVHPVAIRYRILGDAAAALERPLSEIEERIGLRRDPSLGPGDRVRRIGSALFEEKEREILGGRGEGDFASRQGRLVEALLRPLEEEWTDGPAEGGIYGRVKRLRTLLLAGMIGGAVDDAERARRWRQLDAADLALRISLYPPEYLEDDPSPERLLETVERLEEDLTGTLRVHASLSAEATVGEAIPVDPGRTDRGGEDPLLAAVAADLRSLLGIADGNGTA